MAMLSVQKDHPTVSSAAHSMPVPKAGQKHHAGRRIQGIGDPCHPVHQRELLGPRLGYRRRGRSWSPSRRVL